ncbi:MAG: hypothetical protein ACFCUE_05525 [Candidatus Bathyarchaeia archaeon]|jgi:hypothetical protein
MENAAVVECLNFQSGVFPTALKCTPRFADAKPLDSAENRWIWGYKLALIPNYLNAWFNNYGKTAFRDKQVGKSLKMKSNKSNAEQKTILLTKTPVSLATHRFCFGLSL